DRCGSGLQRTAAAQSPEALRDGQWPRQEVGAIELTKREPHRRLVEGRAESRLKERRELSHGRSAVAASPHESGNRIQLVRSITQLVVDDELVIDLGDNQALVPCL